MDFAEFKEDTLLIVPYNMKEKMYLKKEAYSTLLPFSILSFEELKEKIYFSIEEEATLYIMHKYHFCPDVIDDLLESLYFIDKEESYKEEKLIQLQTLYKDLEEHHFLKRNPLFLSKYQTKKVVVYGFVTLTAQEKKLLSYFSDVTILEPNFSCDAEQIFLECETIIDEVEWVTSKILELFEQGVPLRKIRLFGGDSTYQPEFLRMKEFFSFPWKEDAISLYSLPLVQRYLALYKESKDLKQSYYQIEEEKEGTPFLQRVKQELKALVQKYLFYEDTYPEEVASSFLGELKKKTISKEEVYALSLESFQNTIFEEDEYVFFLGMNQNNYPMTYKDEDYLNETIKKKLNLDTTDEKNKQARQLAQSLLKMPKHCYVTYKKYHLKEQFDPSSLLEPYRSLIQVCPSKKVSYSPLFGKVKLCKMLDNLIKYGKEHPYLSSYSKTFPIPYLTYDHTFHKVEESQIQKRCHGKLTLSFSSIDLFYHCPFRYYVQNILKINPFQTSFQAEVGSLFHFVLSKINEEDFDLERLYSSYLEKKTYTKKEQLFLRKLKEELVLFIEEVRRFQKETYLNQTLCEKEFHIDKSTSMTVDLMGIIDKIFYREKNGKTYVAVVDYKTGSKEFRLPRVAYGLDLQLPLYLSFIKESKLFEDPEFAGFYLQKVLSKEASCQKEKDYLTQKRELMKLSGYSTSDEEILEKFDPTYEDSSFIASLRKGKNGFYKYSKVLSKEEITSLIDLADRKVEEARDSILKGEFPIAPKRIKEEDTGCEFCKFRDLCFKTEKDFVVCKEVKNLSLKGGEEDAELDEGTTASNF